MKKILLLGFLGLFFVSCGLKKDTFTNIHAEVNTSLPLGSISLTDSSLFALAGDFVSQLHVRPDDKVLYVKLEDSVLLVDQEKFNSIFALPAQNINLNVNIIPSDRPLPSDPYYTIPDGKSSTTLLKMTEGERVDKMVFGGGFISVTLDGASTIDYSRVRVTLPQIKHTQTNTPLVLTPGTPFALTKDYTITPIQNASYKNGLEIQLSGQVPPMHDLSGEVIIQANNLQEAAGFFGRKQIISPTITLSVSNEFGEFASMVDYLYFKDPKLVFDIKNQYNAPMMITIDKLEISGMKLDLKTGYNNFFVDPNSTARFVLTNANTVDGKQLSELIVKDFKQFVINLNAVMNPTAADISHLIAPPTDYVEPTFNSFAVTDSVFGSYAVSIPFDAVLRNVRFEQKLDVDMSSLNSPANQVQEFAFAFTGKNYMPLDIAVDAFIREGDSKNGAKIKVFEQPIVIEASQTVNLLDAVPSVIEGEDMKIGRIKADMLQRVFKSKTLFFELCASTKDAANDKAVKIFSPSKIDLKVQVGTELDLTLTK